MSASNGKHPDAEVRPRTTRRRFTAAYKRKIVEEAAQCAHGEIGALLRREGLYSSYLTKWREEYAAGTLRNKARGPRANPNAAAAKGSPKAGTTNGARNFWKPVKPGSRVISNAKPPAMKCKTCARKMNN